MPDAHKNFGHSLVATAPSPALSGTSLVVSTGEGTNFPAVPFNAVIWPANARPISSNAEIVRVTAIASDTLTIVRAQENTTAKSITVGMRIDAKATVKIFEDLELVKEAVLDFGNTLHQKSRLFTIYDNDIADDSVIVASPVMNRNTLGFPTVGSPAEQLVGPGTVFGGFGPVGSKINSDGIWLATYSTNKIWRSEDNGETWSEVATIAHGGFIWTNDRGVWLVKANGGGGYFWRSDDNGDTWTSVGSLVSGNFYYNAYGNGIWVFINGDQYQENSPHDTIAVSTDDGLTWTTYDINNWSSFPHSFGDSHYNDFWTEEWRGIAYGNGYFVATLSRYDFPLTTTYWLRSTDGVTWTDLHESGYLLSVYNFIAPVFNGTSFIILGQYPGFGASDMSVYKSTNGETWDETIVSGSDFADLPYSMTPITMPNGTLMIGSDIDIDANALETWETWWSNDGLVWTRRSLQNPGTYARMYNYGIGSGTLLIIGSNAISNFPTDTYLMRRITGGPQSNDDHEMDQIDISITWEAGKLYVHATSRNGSSLHGGYSIQYQIK